MFLGIWLMASPELLKYEGTAGHLDHILGPLVATFACVAIWETTRGLRWLNVPLGLALIAAPWLFGYDWLPLANSSVCGGAIALISALPTRVHESYGGGWTALFAR
jgi:hypothetical protein